MVAAPSRLMIVLAALLPLAAMTGCGSLDRPYYLRNWERSRLAAQKNRFQHHYVSAEKTARDAVAQAEHLGASDFRLAVSLCDLAGILVLREKYKAAKPLLVRALQILQESSAAVKSPIEQEIIEQEKARTLIKLGELDFRNDDYHKALTDYKEAYALLRKWCDPDKLESGNPLGSEFVRSIWGIAECLYKLKEISQAETNFLMALRLAEANAYPIATHLQDRYSAFLKSQGRADQAESAALKWRENSIKGRDARKAKDFRAAREYYLKALAAAAAFRPDDMRLAATYKNMADACMLLGDHKGREYYLQNALKICMSMPHPLFALTDDVLGDLCGTTFGLGKFRESEALRRKQFDLRKKYFGESEKTGEVMLDIADLQIAQRQIAEAIASTNLAWGMVMKEHGRRRKTATTFQRLSDLFFSFRNYARAEEALKETMKIWDIRLQLRGERISNGYFRLAYLASLQHEDKEEKEFHDRAIASFKNAAPKQFLGTINMLRADSTNAMQQGHDPATLKKLLAWRLELIDIARKSFLDDKEFHLAIERLSGNALNSSKMSR